jgi:hypothetical protein
MVTFWLPMVIQNGKVNIITGVRTCNYAINTGAAVLVDFLFGI